MYQRTCDSVHSNDIGSVVGHFYTEPIYSLNMLDVKDREDVERGARIGLSSGTSLLTPDAQKLLDTGEYKICDDHLIRTKTADRQMKDPLRITRNDTKGRRVSIEEARFLAAQGAAILWRPNWNGTKENEYALVLEEATEAPADTTGEINPCLLTHSLPNSAAMELRPN